MAYLKLTICGSFTTGFLAVALSFRGRGTQGTGTESAPFFSTHYSDVRISLKRGEAAAQKGS
jgi:hypothetical protein